MKTPQQSYAALGQAIGISELYLKREDLHPYGSHKGRSIPHMIKSYCLDYTIHNFVISSSGNAALAAVRAIQQHNKNNPRRTSTLKIFVGAHIEPSKLKRLQIAIGKNQSAITLTQVENPKQSAFQVDKDGQAKILRQSTDDLALIGYGELAKELSSIVNMEAIFIPTSSGTTAQALGYVFGRTQKKVQIHIVQTTACHPIADAFITAQNGSNPIITTDSSIASAIVDHVARRKEKVVAAAQSSNGAGWIVTDEEITSAIKLVKEHTGIVISPNSALSIAGAAKAAKNGWKWTGAVVCLITGA